MSVAALCKNSKESWQPVWRIYEHLANFGNDKYWYLLAVIICPGKRRERTEQSYDLRRTDNTEGQIYVRIFLSHEFASHYMQSWRYLVINFILEQFSIECRKTKTKVITLANHKGRRAIHCPIKTRSNYTKRGKSCASKSRLVLVLLVIGFGFTSDWSRKWREILSQSLSVVMQNQSKRKLLSTLKWKPL